MYFFSYVFFVTIKSILAHSLLPYWCSIPLCSRQRNTLSKLAAHLRDITHRNKSKQFTSHIFPSAQALTFWPTLYLCVLVNPLPASLNTDLSATYFESQAISQILIKLDFSQHSCRQCFYVISVSSLASCVSVLVMCGIPFSFIRHTFDELEIRERVKHEKWNKGKLNF